MSDDFSHSLFDEANSNISILDQGLKLKEVLIFPRSYSQVEDWQHRPIHSFNLSILAMSHQDARAENNSPKVVKWPPISRDHTPEKFLCYRPTCVNQSACLEPKRPVFAAIKIQEGAFEILFPSNCHQFGSNQLIKILKKKKDTRICHFLKICSYAIAGKSK